MNPHPTDEFRNTISWLIAASIAVFMVLTTLPWSHTPEGYVPTGNDSFYHARRIIDTATERTPFYEFDKKIHVPEGSQIVWPWAYDYSLALLTSSLMAATGIERPMTVLAYMPAFFAVVNTTLLMLVAGALGLPVRWRLLAGVTFALSAINQSLHGIGVLDHHWVELSFILATLFSTIRWAEEPSRYTWAATTGLLLALAPAFHVAMFILQLPVLISILRLWIKGTGPNPRSAIIFSVFLLGGLLAMLLGSEPFYQGAWHYYLLSWFHFYVAGCSALAVIVMGFCRYSTRTGIIFAGAALAAMYPLVREIFDAGGFFGRTISGLSDIIETQSLATLLNENHQYWLRGYFSYLLVFTPLTLVGCIIGYFRSPSPREVAFGAFGLLSLPLFFLQVRFQYFGIAFLILGPLWGAHKLMETRSGTRNIVMISILGLYATALFASGAQRADNRFELGRDPHYSWVHPLMPKLAEVCNDDPGIVLAAANEGHFIRFHSECPVIANNFLLTRQHARKYREVRNMLQWSPAELRDRRPDVEYVLATHRIFKQYHPSGLVTLANRAALAEVNDETPLITTLLLSPADQFRGYELIDEVLVDFGEGETVPYARLFQVNDLPASGERAGN